jgi:AAA domain
MRTDTSERQAVDGVQEDPMTQRERQTSDGANGPVALPSALASPSAGDCPPSAWEALFLSSPTTRRQELLARSRSDGVVYAHQFPAPEATATRAFPAAALLNGRARELTPSRPPAVAPDDIALDADQREAVARALHTPDVCVISGVAGSGKSRVVAEILCRAASRGERVLLLAPGTAALDHVLGRLRNPERFWPVRCPAADEDPGQLPGEVRAFTLDGRVRQFQEETVPKARAAASAARERLDALRRQEQVLQHLAELDASRAESGARVAALDARQTALAADIAASTRDGSYCASPFAPELVSANQIRDEAVAGLDAQDATVRAEQEKLRAALNVVTTDEDKVRALLAARRGWRFWSGFWWRALRQRDLGEQLEHLQSVRGELETNLAARAEEAAALVRERAAADETFRSAVNRFVDAETRRRCTAIERERADESARLSQLDFARDTAAATLDPTTRAQVSMPGELSRFLAGRAERIAKAEENLTAAERWAAAVVDALPDVHAHLASAADIVAATTATISGDPHFGDGNAAFDLLVLEEADRVTEAEFVRVARRARRWVLVGDSSDDRSAGHSERTVRPTGLRPGFFQRLWDNLHTDPRRLPYSWRRLDDGRLSCLLRPVVPDSRSRIETECVADCPEVELRILTPPRGAPELIEVVFPGGMSVAEAKSYLFQELDELAIRPAGRGLRWAEEAGRVVLWLGQPGDTPLEAAAIADGISEHVGISPMSNNGDASSLTYALAFDRSAGWSREQAEEWTARHAGLRDSGRTVYLGTPRRMRPALARFVTRFLAGNAYVECGLADKAAPDSEPAVEFIAVPSLLSDGDSRPHGDANTRRRGPGPATTPRLRAVKGAGLETELGDARRPDVLPAEFRQCLPPRGLVNYMEACAIVRELESLLARDKFRTEVEAWQNANGRRAPSVAVIALYAAQAELIRQLVARAPALANCSHLIEIGTPDRFRQRECLAALVSLTRSHAHRPVSLGEGPQALALAVTRARARLLVFGDAGTLVRRGQCADPVDHLDPAGSARERAMVAHLVACIHSNGDGDAGFRLRQGRGT